MAVPKGCPHPRLSMSNFQFAIKGALTWMTLFSALICLATAIRATHIWFLWLGVQIVLFCYIYKMLKPNNRHRSNSTAIQFAIVLVGTLPVIYLEPVRSFQLYKYLGYSTFFIFGMPLLFYYFLPIVGFLVLKRHVGKSDEQK